MTNCKLATLMLAGALSTIAASNAYAFEDTSILMPGITIGDPTGAAPPPGLYFMTGSEYFNLPIVGNNKKATGLSTTEYDSVNQLLWVPKLPPIFGATYYNYVVAPIRGLNLQTPGPEFTQFGFENTVISPLNLSWNLHNGFFVAAGLTFYLPDGTYKSSFPIHVSRNYFSTELDFSASYLADGWNLTIHNGLGFNAVNPANGYQSGIGLVTDYTALHQFFGNFEFGAVGSTTFQLSNDTIHGKVVAASSLYPGNGVGNRATTIEIGPGATYNFGAAKVMAYWLHDVYASNYGYGNRFYVKLELPLWIDADKPAVVAKY